VSLYADAVAALNRWRPPNDAQRGLATAYLGHLAEHPDGLTRDCHPDHLTASALVVDETRERVLLNLHRRYEIWVQFGGHCEPEDGRLHEAALREAVEESGIADLRLVDDLPVQLSTHEVRCGPIRPSHHLDVRYVAEAPAGAVSTVSDESLDVAWFAPDALPDGVDAPLRELIGWALNR
jgi:8-oxo-dGTP pyrophosphatase MutT (NUDIX family)